MSAPAIFITSRYYQFRKNKPFIALNKLCRIDPILSQIVDKEKRKDSGSATPAQSALNSKMHRAI